MPGGGNAKTEALILKESFREINSNMRRIYFLLIIFFAPATFVFSQLKTIKIDDAVIHYKDKGTGEAIIFVHGGMEDYRTWDSQIDSFSKKYRVIAYSRRFNYPNQNTNEIKNFSAETEANDLARLIVQLKVQPVHLVGHSFGAVVALSLAIRYPQLVQTLTLSEPPMISWLPGLDGGKQLYDDFYDNLMKPVKQDFEQKDTIAVLRHTLIYFYGSDVSKELSEKDRTQLIANFPEWRAIAYSTNVFPLISKEEVTNLKMPVLLLSAGQTMSVLKVTNAELKRLLPNAQHFQLAEGTHDYWITNPKQMGNALMNFLQTVWKN
jgi:pimeloyl-ACP methyl ester carboxylesterase